MVGSRQKGQPDREIYNLFAALNQEQQREKHDIHGIYEGRLRSHAQNFEGVKRKWEGFTGVLVPKKLRTSDADAEAPVEPNQKPATKTVKRAKAPAPAKEDASVTTAMPPHPDDNINVDNMIVKRLQKELKKRGLGAVGRKAELQARLREHLAEARKQREADWAAKHAVAEKEEARIKHVKIGNDDGMSASSKENAKKVDVVMKDADGVDPCMSVEPEKVGPVKKTLASSMRTKEGETKPAKKSATATTTVGAMKNNLMKNQAPPKSALKPSKYASASAQSAAKLGVVKPAAMPAPASLAKEILQAPQQPVPTKVSDESSYAAVPKPSTASETMHPHGSKAAKISSTLAQTEPGGSALKPKSASAKLLEKKKAHAAANEARKARMAEMRQKSAAVSSAKAPPSHSKYASSSTLKKMAIGSTLGESKPNNLLAKMREKAAAEKHTANATAAANSTEPAKYSGSKVLVSKPAPNPTALKSILDPANRPAVVSKVPPKPSPPKEKPLSPMQTYEMSDREEDSSDSESESDEEYERKRPKKAIPEWAQRSNLHRALERQFMEGPGRLDPDKIFGEVVTCNLEEIFDMKKAKYKRRTSSGNWSKDAVRLSEKLKYRATMGFN